MKYLSTLLATTCTRPPLLTMKMPKTALDLLPVEVTDHAIFAMAAERNWNAFRECYPSEEECIEALRINVAVVLPYGADSVSSGFYELGEAVDRSGNIAGSYAVLQEKLDGSDAVLDVITKNPGVLGCIPSKLEKAEADDITRAASIASGIDGVLGPARRFLKSQSWWDEGMANKAKEPPSTEDSSGPIGNFNPLGFGEAKDKAAEDGELQLPTIEVEGVEYLYDFKGDFNGVEHVLITMEGEAVAVWNAEEQEFEAAEFVDE